jgi:eukaryotic-like serine/threonine-protein kinase
MTDLQELLAHTLSDRYSVENEIGRGRIARVYAAHDRKHGRRVAIKVLHPELATGLAVSRFHREIAIAASLHHPHILPLYDSGQAEDLVYFTMPYVEGEALADVIARSMPVPEALRIACDVAKALVYAHSRGIVHRDVKPGNILISGGIAQVADFGIARAVLEASGDRLTEAGLIVGTPAYMSPEQWDDPGSADERSDLYGLACVLYEMLVGTPPFHGPTAHSTLALKVMHPPPSIRVARPEVSEQLDDAVRRALARDPGERQPSLAAFADELEEIEAVTRTHVATAQSERIDRWRRIDRPGILVLPFLLFAPRPDDAYIANGLTDEIITSLSGLQALRVISYTSAVQLKGTTQRPRDLGRDLDVSFVLEGSVRLVGDVLRITTRLIATDSEVMVWGQSYDGSAGDLLELEKTISRAVVAALAVRVSTNENRRLYEHRIADARAFEYYLRAKQLVYTFTGPALDRALEYLQKGAEICGENITIWAAIGYVNWQYINAGISADPVYFQRARDCAARIRQIDPASPEAHRLLGLIEIHAKGDPQIAVDHLKAALDASPNDPDTLFWLSLIYGCVGRPSSGYPLAIRLLDIDPLTPLHHVVPGFLDVLDGDPLRALTWLKRAHDLDQANPIISIAYGQALVMAGEREQGCQELDRIREYVPDSFFAGLGQAFSQAAQSHREEALAAIGPDVVGQARHDLQYSWTLAQCYAMIGQFDDARDWVANAVRQGFWNYPLLAERDALLEPMRDNPAYQDLMATTKRKWLDFRA